MTVRAGTSVLFLALYICSTLGAEAQVDQTVTLRVDGSQHIRRLPRTLFGLFFEVRSFLHDLSPRLISIYS